MAMIAFFASSDEKIATVKNDAYLCLGTYSTSKTKNNRLVRR